MRSATERWMRRSVIRDLTCSILRCLWEKILWFAFLLLHSVLPLREDFFVGMLICLFVLLLHTTLPLREYLRDVYLFACFVTPYYANFVFLWDVCMLACLCVCLFDYLFVMLLHTVLSVTSIFRENVFCLFVLVTSWVDQSLLINFF